MDASYRQHANELLGRCPTLQCTMHRMAFDIRREVPALDTTSKKDVIEEKITFVPQLIPMVKPFITKLAEQHSQRWTITLDIEGSYR
jgi:hypothetical protein